MIRLLRLVVAVLALGCALTGAAAAEEFNVDHSSPPDKYMTNEFAAKAPYWDETNNLVQFLVAPVGTAGNNITWTEAFTIDPATGRLRIGGTGAVGAGPLLVNPPSVQTIAGGGTIAADACGGIKTIQSTGNVTTSTTDTFTTPAAANTGCCMDVVNVDTVDTITLDVNGNFITGVGTDIAVGPGDAVRVCSNGVDWYQGAAVTSLAASGSSIDGLSDAINNTTEFNMWLGSNTQMFAGAQYNTFVGQSTGAAGTSNAADYNTAVGWAALDALTTGAGNTAVGESALSANTTGYWNTAFGVNALIANVTGFQNTAIGLDALASSTGSNNTAIGFAAGWSLTSGENNVAVGSEALMTATTSYGNTAVGSSALKYTTGQSNVAFGRMAMIDASNGSSNTALGDHAMSGLFNGYENVGIGVNAGQDIYDGNNNVFIGDQAATNMVNSNNNVIIGANAADSMTGGHTNIIIGFNVEGMSASGSDQLNIGDTLYGDLANDRIRIGGSGAVSAGPLLVQPPATETVAAAATITANACGTIKAIQSTSSVTTNTTNTFTAPAAGNAGCCMIVTNVDTADTITLDVNANFITGTGTDIAVGPGDGVQVCSNGTTWYQGNALSSLAAGGGGSIDSLTDARYDTATGFNMALGTELSFFSGAQYNLFVGQNAGGPGLANTMDYNTALGYGALDAIEDGDRNTAIGYLALSSTADGNRTVAIGHGVLQLTGWSSQNVAIGYAAMSEAVSAESNVAIGYSTMQALRNADNNVAIGLGALQGNYGNGTGGDNNVALGVGALGLVDPGAGVNALGNIGVGYQAGNNITTGNYNITIGYDIDTPSATANSQLTIGNLIFATGGFGTGTTVGAGNVGIKDPSPGTALEVTGGFTITPATTVNLTGDNQLVTVGNNSYIRVSSNNATPTNRTFCLSAGTAAGQQLIIEQIGNGFQAEMEDLANPACTGDAPQSLTATMTFNSLDDTLSLIWNGTSWLETARANN